MEEKDKCFSDIRGHLEALQSVNMTMIVEDLWAVTEKEKHNMPFNKFLTPPVRTCLRCQKFLTMRNYPANVKLFTTEGPIPCSKITLECRSCSCVYRVCNFNEDLGDHLYPTGIDRSPIEIIEVSNVT